MTLANSKYFFVVTRNKRRVEDKNYSNIQDAETRASNLKEALKRFDPQDVKNVKVTRTKKPNQIR